MRLAITGASQCAIVVVATLQSFRVEETDKRRVYSFSEQYENHFRTKTDYDLRVLNTLPDALVAETDLTDTERGKMLRPYLGKPKRSLANWLALQSPIVIVDEAHNAKTDRSFTTLARLNPAMILELTATPVAGKANVLYHVSAQQLQAENMIKMPIMLAEHKDGWEKAVLAAIQTRGALADAAVKEHAAGRGYIRPIVLFQATNENGDVPPEKLRTYLQDELKIAPEEIAVATGNTRELDGEDLASPANRILFIITVRRSGKAGTVPLHMCCARCRTCRVRLPWNSCSDAFCACPTRLRVASQSSIEPMRMFVRRIPDTLQKR